ncbi:hypothetical protein P43SY_005929 [Pythium insidiosum]|uniref:BD-FAE-like domain-containing protein n=1 Tax=Pythium insidiosum TaxID=114742 RepID=A0AAD5QCU9_PYTIN|nr:hypothetical protein P43SY_005929 [Pythium insidiosum]
MLPLPALDKRVRERLRRFAISIALLLYARRTWRTFHDHHFHLQLQAERVSPGRHLLNILKYTFVAQLLAACEYLIPIAKPVLAWRIARLLVWRGENVVANVLYGSHPRNTIDIYGVDLQAENRKPVLLFVHGGAWSFGHKWQYGLVGKYLAKHGFLVAVINYRTYPLGSVTEQTKDVEDAIHWVAEHAARYGGDREKIFLIGHSSGAHISALTLVQSAVNAISGAAETSETTGRVHHHIKGFIGLAGPYDIAEHYDFESRRKVGPINGVHEISTMKPAMLGMSHFDDYSPAKREARQHADYIELEGCTHEDIVFADSVVA